MKIKKVSINNRKKCFEVTTAKGTLALPFSRLRLKPSRTNTVAEVYVDRELGSEGITYRLESGKEDSIHLDAFLDYNRDPDFLRNLVLHQLTIEAVKAMKHSDLSKHEIIRRLQTSPSQLYRLLDPANYSKSVDEMLRLLAVLGCDVRWDIVQQQVA
jgi:antitoxin HicB